MGGELRDLSPLEVTASRKMLQAILSRLSSRSNVTQRPKWAIGVRAISVTGLSWLLAVDWRPFQGGKAFLSFCNPERKNLSFSCLVSASVRTENRTTPLFEVVQGDAAWGRNVTSGEAASHFQAEPSG